MAEIGGMLAAAAVKAVYGKVAAAAGDLVAQHRRFSKDIEYLRDTLESINAVMEDAERRSVEEKSVQLWLKRLTAASYDISDIFDELEANATRKSALRKLKVLNLCLTAASKVGMADRMREVRERLENISKQRQELSFTAANSSYAQQVIDERETSSELINADTILGRDQDKQKVIELLTQANPSSEFIILPIYGIGGIGKTTLAKLVFNDAHFKDFEKAWVRVSQTFDLKKVGDSTRSQLQNNQNQLTDTEQPHDDPPALTKILIVLDDLWENDEFKVDDLKHSLKKFCNGRKVHVIVTTRDASIAQKIQTTDEAYAIEPLSSDTCWSIIKQAIVGFEDRADKRRLEDIGKEIAMKCQGVALAARALGYILMRSMNFDGWVSVRDNDIWNISATECTPSPYDTVLASLKLSYISMLPYLRPCFAYCAIFPKGRKMAKDDLIYQWAALGFINKLSNEDSTWLQNGESIINQLLGMSFLQHSNSPSSYGQHSKNVTFFTMHDLVHDLARSIMRDEVLDTTIKHNARGSNYRYVSLADCKKPLNSFVTYPDKIRALCFPGSAKVGRDADGFSSAKYLRVLDLAECSIQNLPYSIGQLKLLRYLNAPGIKDRVIPSCITKLSKLIYLNLRGSSEILALPESIGEMEDLQYLDLSGCDKIRKLPKSFEKLKNLVHLDLSDCPEANGIARALCSLTKLRYLNLSREHEWIHRVDTAPLRGLPEVIGKLIELRYLNLSNCQYYIFGPRTMVSEDEENSYPYIQKKENSGSVGSFLETISSLSNLEHLDLSINMNIYSIPDSFCSLSKLHTLDLTRCYDLERLPENVGDMDMLKFLIVKDCSRLINMSNLQSNKHVIPLPEFVVHAAEDEHSSNLVLLKNASPPELELHCLENVKSVEEARAIKLREKQSMVKLTLAWTAEKGFVEDMELLRELVPPRNLEHFELSGYNNVIFPTWLMDIAKYLPNLVSVCLWGITQCGSLPPLGQLPNLKRLKLVAVSGITKIDRSFCGGVKAFTRLEDFSMFRMESLEEWTTAYSKGEGGVADQFMFPNLMDLEICRCHKLRLNPCPPIVKGTWHITESDGVLSQWGESSLYTGTFTSSASLACLFIESSMAPLHQWKLLRHLPAIKKLNIQRCNDLNSSSDIVGSCSLRELTLISCDISSLPQWLGHLTTLQKLRIGSCRSLNNLPEWLGDLVSLKNLSIFNCDGIMSLPESIQRLTKLKHLSIEECPALEKWGKLKENKKKIRHIKEVRWKDKLDLWSMLAECVEDLDFSEE